MDFREWETFFLGAATRMEGKSSRRRSRMMIRTAEIGAGDSGGVITQAVDEEGRQRRDQELGRNGRKSRGLWVRKTFVLKLPGVRAAISENVSAP